MAGLRVVPGGDERRSTSNCGTPDVVLSASDGKYVTTIQRLDLGVISSGNDV